MSVVARSGGGDQSVPMLQVQRIAEIRFPDGLGGGIGAPRSGVAIPLGQRMLLIVGHQADGQRLAMQARLFERGVENLPADLSFLGLERGPMPTAVCDGSLGENGFRRHRSERLGGTGFGPSETRIQRLAVVSLKSSDPHARVDENAVDFSGPDNDMLGLSQWNEGGEEAETLH